ncbi:hypothetical protein GCM10020256_66600 [Streptomyces thermocoprophilus]
MKRLVTVVTGGSRGIGAAVCRRLAEDGHDVVVGYVRDAGAADEVAADVRRVGARAVTVRADTSVEAEVERLFETAERELGPVTGLVNNAAVSGPLGRLTDTDTDVLRRVVDVNLTGTLLCARRAAQLMTARGERRDREHLLGRGHARQPRGVRPLRRHEGRGGRAHGGPGQGAGPGRCPRQRGRARRGRHGDARGDGRS